MIVAERFVKEDEVCTLDYKKDCLTMFKNDITSGVFIKGDVV
jgi:hypothetical protein